MKVKFYKINVNLAGYGGYKEYLDKRPVAEKVAEILDLKLKPIVEEAWEGYKGFDYFGETTSDLVVSQATFLELAELTNAVELSRVLTANLGENFQLMADKQYAAPVENIYNQKCEVHTPGNTLTTYNQVMLVEDACTDMLQSHLNSGWRMICACPQSDQRRPDYILGRFNPDLEVAGNAERG